MITEKIWGTTDALIVTPMFEMHRLVIQPHYRCSYHEHQFKHNAFYVINGQLFIDVQRPGRFRGRVTDEHELRTGDTFTVAPGVAHQFRTGQERCIALEMYYTEPLSEDIHRFDQGCAHYEE